MPYTSRMSNAKRGATCTRNSKVMLSFLPYSGREPYRHNRMYGTFEECFDTEVEAKARLRELARERRIEDAAITVAIPTGGQRRTLLWWDKRIPKKDRRSFPG